MYSKEISAYRRYGFKEAAKLLGISVTKLRKMLVTAGAYQSPATIEAAHLQEQGLSTEDIAREMGISISYASSLVPYSKGEYNLEEKSQNARNIEAMRIRQASGAPPLKPRCASDEERQNRRAESHRKQNQKAAERIAAMTLEEYRAYRDHINALARESYKRRKEKK